jgi:hypothetical protein
MEAVREVRLRLEKTVASLGELIHFEGEVSPPVPLLEVLILCDNVVITTAKTDSMGKFSGDLFFTTSGTFKVKAVVGSVESEPIPVTVTYRVVTVAPPAPVVEVPRVEVPVPALPLKLSEVSLEDFSKMMHKVFRDSLFEAIGISQSYVWDKRILHPDEKYEYDLMTILRRPAWEGYIINDHDTESLWIAIHDGVSYGPWIEVRAGEVYPFYKRFPVKVWVHNRSSVDITYRLELR